MQPATSDKWLRYYQAGAEHRRRQGGDPLRRYREKVLAREKLALLGATGCLAALFGLAYFVLVSR